MPHPTSTAPAWINPYQMYLVQPNGDDSTIVAISNDTTARYFDLSGGVYQVRFFGQEQLVHDTGARYLHPHRHHRRPHRVLRFQHQPGPGPARPIAAVHRPGRQPHQSALRCQRLAYRHAAQRRQRRLHHHRVLPDQLHRQRTQHRPGAERHAAAAGGRRPVDDGSPRRLHLLRTARSRSATPAT